MGMDISPVDLINIDMFAARVVGLTEYRKVIIILLLYTLTYNVVRRK